MSKAIEVPLWIAKSKQIEIITDALNVKYIADTAIVSLSKSYGSRKWFWFPNITCDELERFWKDLPSLNPYFDSSNFEDELIKLPGHMILYSHEEEYTNMWEWFSRYADYRCHIDTNITSYLEKTVYIYHKGHKKRAVN